MKITLIATLGLLALVGCVHTEAEKPTPDVCPATYNPHLCLAAVRDKLYSAHGTNECVARNKLLEILRTPGVTKVGDLIAVQCGEVYE